MDNFSLNVDYRIVRKIAEGGMGSVYEALQCGAAGFEKRVAVKVLLPQYAQRSDFLEMFIHEAQLVASLVHENIVQLHQLGFQSDSYLIVMEYIHGYPLDQFIDFHRKKLRKIPEELAVFIASRIARGLAYAHARPGTDGKVYSIVHRDVSPKNVLVTSEGLPKLADFGLAMVIQGEQSKAAQSYKAGKLSYMPPEQARGQDVDRRTDLFALGAILFELLTLEPIRKGENRFHQLKQAADGEVRWEILEVNDRLTGILQRCLALKPEDRFERTQDLAEQLERYIYEVGYGPTIQRLKAYAEEIGIVYR